MVLGDQTSIVSLTTGKAQLSCRDFKCISYLKIEKKRIVYNTINTALNLHLLCPLYMWVYHNPQLHKGHMKFTSCC